MRTAGLLVILFAAAVAGCDREGGSDSGAPEISVSSATTRRGPPTTAEVLAQLQATTRAASTQIGANDASTTGPSAMTGASGASADPLATPEATVKQMFDLMQKEDVTGVRAMMLDPMPAEKLRAEISAIADRMNSGAKWEIVNSHVQGVAAVVIFRTTFPDGKKDFSPLILINRYDRWKVQLGPLNVRRFSGGEKESLNKVLPWAGKEVDALRGVTTKPATKPAQ